MEFRCLIFVLAPGSLSWSWYTTEATTSTLTPGNKGSSKDLIGSRNARTIVFLPFKVLCEGRLLVVLKLINCTELVDLCSTSLRLYLNSNSDDHLLKNIELFDRLSLSFNGRILFIKDVIGDEICCWSFYGQGRKLAEVCCTSIVYATEKKQTKVRRSGWWESPVLLFVFCGFSSGYRVPPVRFLLCSA